MLCAMLQVAICCWQFATDAFAVCNAEISVCVAAVLEAGEGRLHQDHAEPGPGCQTPAEGH